MGHKSFGPTLLHRLYSLSIVLVMVSSLVSPMAQPVSAATTPTPISPTDGIETTITNYPPTAIPSVVWMPVEGANNYRVQFSSDPGFASVAAEVITTNTSYTPPSMSTTLFSDGVWYWHVRVESPGTPGNYSFTMSFNKQWAAPDNLPTLETPADGTTLDFLEYPVFTWSRVTGATRYRMEIATSLDGFNTPIYSKDTISTSHQPNTLHALGGNGTYYWRVRPIDAGAHFGTSSEAHSFTLAYGTSAFGEVPTLLEPANNSQPIFTPTFHWTAIPGAEKYEIEYMTDDGICEAGTGISTKTSNTSYTPTIAFANDDYCWHVRVTNGKTNGEWSETWRFHKRWLIPPVPLTPTNTYQYGLYPLYTWAPVPGAYYYKIEIALNHVWYPPFDTNNTGNPWYTPRNYYGTTDNPYYWRVTPYDYNGNPGQTSSEASFRSIYTSTAPSLVYPLYYYLPNDPNVYGEVEVNPYADHTAPYPVFIWQRVNNPWPYGDTYAGAYRIEVSKTPLFSTLEWTVDTESTHAAPTQSNPFSPSLGQDYYWRVCPLDSLGGDCLVTPPPDNGEWWSQIWRARFDPSRGISPTNGDAPELIRPAHGDEWVEAVPLLEWKPYQDADYYQVQISRDPDFGDLEAEEEVPYPAFSSLTSFAQRFLGRTDYGTFYWRVRANVSSTWTDWSEAWRFQIASQSEWQLSRAIMDANNRLLIGDDPNDATPDNYELTTLYASNSNENWYFGFNATLDATDMTYGLYLDIDHLDGSGATQPPSDRSYTISTVTGHQPEFAIFIDQVSGSVNAQNTWVYEWKNNSYWDYPQKLSEMGGDLQFSSGYLEIEVPNSAIGMNNTTGSYSLMAFSINLSSNTLVDSVPSDPEVPGSGNLSRFTSVSEQMNLLYPFNTIGGDPTTSPYIGPFLWDFPTGGDPEGDGTQQSSPFSGSHIRVGLAPQCNDFEAEVWQYSNTMYFASANQTLLNDIVGDSTYYWCIQPRYLFAGNYGVWNSGYSFNREGFIPQNLQTSVTFATPVFSWDMVDGAGAYDLVVATDPNFGSSTIVINTLTAQNSYIPLSTLANGTYYWHVRVHRYSGIIDNWSSTASFALDLPVPTGLTPNDPSQQSPVNYMPTLCWDRLVAYDEGVPVMAAWKYRLQIASDPGFSQIFETVDTEQNCYTPSIPYADGTYYWHVAMIDGSSRASNYTSTAQFTKQYPVTTLLEPISGMQPGTPTYKWTPVDGAAYYKLEVSKSSGFSPIYDSILTVNTQYTPVFTYEKNVKFYWRVAMLDYGSKFGPFTGAEIIVGTYYLAHLPIVSKSP
jgi:hypothetical protein